MLKGCAQETVGDGETVNIAELLNVQNNLIKFEEFFESDKRLIYFRLLSNNIMYRQIEDFITDWGYESANTLNILRHIDDQSLIKKENENIRSIAVLSWHITITLSEMMNLAGLEVNGPEEHSKPPLTMSEIIKVYDNSAVCITNEVKEKWKDENLTDEVNMYGDVWKRGTVLSILIRHQAHHRGQLIILMRKEGCRVPGIYGPSKEEWENMNMEAPE